MARSLSPLKVDRFKQLLDLVQSRQRISLAELESLLKIPRITIQRDLVELDHHKLLRRFHGGAMSLDFSRAFYDYTREKSVNVKAKTEIAAKANRLLRENSAVCLDASSTVYYLSETIFPANILVLACGIDAFRNLCGRDDLQTVLAGGRMHHKTRTLYGPEMLRMIRNFRFDLSFISSEAYVTGGGFFDPHEEEVAVKRAIIESSQRTVMLIDSSKIAPASGIRVCGNDEIDCVITDDPAASPLRKVFGSRLL